MPYLADTHGSWLEELYGEIRESEPAIYVLADAIEVPDRDPDPDASEANLNRLFQYVYECVRTFEQRWGLPDWHTRVEAETAALPDVTEAVAQLRETTQLPMKDIAAMLGIKRRHVYNLLDGEAASAATIGRVHAANDVVRRLRDLVGDEPQDARNALLVPVDGDLSSTGSQRAI